MKTIVTKAQYAALKARQPGSVSNWIRDGKISARALVGTGVRRSNLGRAGGSRSTAQSRTSTAGCSDAPNRVTGQAMSALPPIADICSAHAHVRFVPRADIARPASFGLLGDLLGLHEALYDSGVVRRHVSIEPANRGCFGAVPRAVNFRQHGVGRRRNDTALDKAGK